MLENFENYKLFYYIGKYQNITKAAKELYLSQPTVTKEIHSFEEHLGCKLFARASKGVKLTPEGELLYERIAPLIEGLIQAEAMIKQIGDQSQGVLALGANRQLTGYILEQLFLEKFRKEYQGVGIEFMYGHRNVQDSAIETRLIDLGFSLRPVNDETIFTMAEFEKKNHIIYTWQPEREIYRIMHSSYIGVVSPAVMRKLKLNGKVSLSALYDIPMVLQLDDDKKLQKRICGLSRRSGDLEDNDFQTGSVPDSIWRIENSYCFGLVNEVTVQDEISTGKLIPLDLEEKLPEMELVMFYAKNFPLRLNARILKDYILEQKGMITERVETDAAFKK